MDIDLQPGRYVVAVSGGVDSVVLLHLLAQRAARESGWRLTVAHFDHGIREDSARDRRHVQALARHYGLPFVYTRAELGKGVSEDVARRARYGFLHSVRQASGAEAVVTAHHQDDLLETVILNLLRGTGRRGLSSLKSTDTIKRPLLNVPKKELLRYAVEQGLTWREDSTNADEKYLRNYIRRRILPRFAEQDREALLKLSARTGRLNGEIERQETNFLHVQPARGVLDRHAFTMLPHAVAREIMAQWLRANTGVELNRKMLERLVVAAKTGRAGTKIDVAAGHRMQISPTRLALLLYER